MPTDQAWVLTTFPTALAPCMLLAKACRKSPRLPAVAPDPPKLLTRFWKLCCKLVSEPDLHAVEQVKAVNGHVYLLFSTVPRHEIDHIPPAAGKSSPGAVAAAPEALHPHGHHHHFPIEPIIAGLFASLGFAALLAWYFSKPIHSLRSAFE